MELHPERKKGGRLDEGERSRILGPLQSCKNVSIRDASVSAVPGEMAGIKGLSSCGRQEMQSQRRERRLHYAHTRIIEQKHVLIEGDAAFLLRAQRCSHAKPGGEH